MGNHLWTTLSSIGTSGMLKHFLGGLIIPVTARSVCLLLFPWTEGFFSQPRSAPESFCQVWRQPAGADWLTFPRSLGCRSLTAQWQGVRKGHCLSSRWGHVLGRGNRTKLLTWYPRINLTLLFYFTGSSKAAGNSLVFFLTLSCAWCSSDSGLPRQGSFLSAGKIDQHLSLHTAVSQTPKGLFILWH